MILRVEKGFENIKKETGTDREVNRINFPTCKLGKFGV